ncbi:hypothetical protein KI387_031348, partial [Taxus chinensis]
PGGHMEVSTAFPGLRQIFTQLVQFGGTGTHGEPALIQGLRFGYHLEVVPWRH